MVKKVPKDFDDYASRYSNDVQQRLRKMRATITKAAPKAKETISYGVPCFNFDRPLVWFAAGKSHIGFYPGALAIATFKKDLSGYKSAKGSVQFPNDEELPLALVTRIVKFKMQQSSGKSKKT
jgi:uncharacterized protein YdhG (YjbR/CyaY superfamily)